MTRIAIGLSLWVATFLLYLPSTSHYFISLDDGDNVFANELLSPPSWANVAKFWQKPYRGEYLPVTYTVWAGLVKTARALGNDTPWGHPDPYYFHLCNVLLHAANAALVFVLGVILLAEYSVPPLAIGFGALLFGFHPASVEPVAWITGLKDVLSTFIGFLTLFLYWRAATRSAESGQRRWHIAATACFILAILAKPSMVILPLVAWLGAFTFLKRRWNEGVWCLAFWLALDFVVICVNRAAQVMPASFHVTIGQRVTVAADALFFYFRHVLAPTILVPDYGRSLPWVTANVSRAIWLFPLALAVLPLLAKPRRVWWGITALFVSGVLPVLGLVPFQFQVFSTVADRYLYFSLFSLSLAAAMVMSRLRHRAIGIGLMGILLGLAGLCASRQLQQWKDTETLFRYTLSQNPQSVIAHNSLGTWLDFQGLPNQAITHLRFAAEHCPLCEQFRIVFIQELVKEERWSEVATECKKMLETRPNAPDLNLGLGKALMMTSRFSEALAPLQKALAVNPTPATYRKIIEALTKSSRREEAMAMAERAARQFPDDPGLRALQQEAAKEPPPT